MPVFQRRTLRQTLAREYIRDLITGTHAGVAQNAGLGSLNVSDVNLADVSASGRGLYADAYIRLGGGGSAADYRVATFTCASGRFDSQMVLQATILLLGPEPFEIHELTRPTEKDLAIDDTIRRVRVRREVGIASVDGLLFYTVDGAASPNTIVDVLDAYFYSNPGGSLDLRPRTLDWARLVSTATGNMLRIAPALSSSMQLVLDAILELTLGQADEATINLPDDRWILSGAAARCWDLVAARAPSQELTLVKQRRADMAAQFTKLALRFQPAVDRRVRFDDPGL